MKLPLVKQVSKEDLGGGDIPSWMDGFLGVYNQNMQAMATALLGKLTFADNFLCKATTQNFTHATALTIGVDKVSSVFGVIPLKCQNSTDTTASTKGVITGIGVTIIGNGSISVIVNYAGGAGIKADVDLLILYR